MRVDLECYLWVFGDPAITYVSNLNGAWDPDAGEDGDWCSGFPESNGYGFKVASGFDLNQNMALEGGDIDAWLAEPVDFNGVNDADMLDLAILIDAIATGGE